MDVAFIYRLAPMNVTEMLCLNQDYNKSGVNL